MHHIAKIKRWKFQSNNSKSSYFSVQSSTPGNYDFSIPNSVNCPGRQDIFDMLLYILSVHTQNSNAAFFKILLYPTHWTFILFWYAYHVRAWSLFHYAYSILLSLYSPWYGLIALYSYCKRFCKRDFSNHKMWQILANLKFYWGGNTQNYLGKNTMGVKLVWSRTLWKAVD